MALYCEELNKFSDQFKANKGFTESLMAKVNKLNRPTEGGRIHKMIAERVCELVFLIRRVIVLLTEGLFPKQLSKKQTLQQYLHSFDRDESFVSVIEKLSDRNSSVKSTSDKVTSSHHAISIRDSTREQLEP